MEQSLEMSSIVLAVIYFSKKKTIVDIHLNFFFDIGYAWGTEVTILYCQRAVPLSLHT